MKEGRFGKWSLWICATLFMTLCLTAAAAPAESLQFRTMSDFIGKKIAAVSGTLFDNYIEDNKILQGQVEIMYQNTDADAIALLTDHKCDAIAMDDPDAKMAVAVYDSLIIFPEPLCEDRLGFGFQKGSPLVEPFNKALKKLMDEGITEKMEKKWLTADESGKVLIPQDWEGENGTLRYWVNTGSPPMAYLGPEGKPIGYTVDLLFHVAREMGYNVEITGCSFDGLIPALQNGKADIAGRSLSITEERLEKIDFSDPFYEGGAMLVIRKEDMASSVMAREYGLSEWEPSEEGQSIPVRIGDGFYRTFIEESRWKVFARGLFTTIFISIASAFFGTLLGFALFLLCRKTGPAVRRIVKAVMGVIVGIPAVVLLLVLFYVVFAKSSLSGIPVSIIAFSLTFGSSVLRMLETGTGAVDPGQTEGAYALGFNDTETFFIVILPQALRHILPVFKGELGGLVKATAIVGYIAAHDLTKAGDLVRNRTFEAFFSLISVAVIYYFLGKLLAFLVSRIEVFYDPSRRTKEQILRGVTEHV